MNKSVLSLAAMAAMLFAPLAAQAVVIQFNATINAAQQVPPSSSTATGLATLFYDDKGTLSLLDDTYNFTASAFGLSGGTVAGTAASVYHIHNAAAGSNGPVIVGLDAAPFVSFNSGSTLLVGGTNVVPPSNFLANLQASLTYVNIHTAANPGGAIRGQLIQVAVVPEPSTYAMMLAGLGLVGFMAKRRRQAV